MVFILVPYKRHLPNCNRQDKKVSGSGWSFFMGAFLAQAEKAKISHANQIRTHLYSGLAVHLLRSRFRGLLMACRGARGRSVQSCNFT